MWPLVWFLIEKRVLQLCIHQVIGSRVTEEHLANAREFQNIPRVLHDVLKKLNFKV